MDPSLEESSQFDGKLMVNPPPLVPPDGFSASLYKRNPLIFEVGTKNIA
jgi:hypothetical protein